MNEDRRDIARKILDYLRKNPDAGDTLEGISRWWVQNECVEQSVDTVAGALETLIMRGLVRKEDIKGGSPLFKICRKSD